MALVYQIHRTFGALPGRGAGTTLGQRGKIMTFTGYLASLPTWILLPGVVLLSVGVAIAGLLLFHRKVELHIRQRHNDVAGFVYAVLGIPYGVLVGFAVLVVWEQFNVAQTNVAQEVSAVRAVFREISVYPRPEEVAGLKASLAEYVHSIVNDEFPAMARMEKSAKTQAVSGQVWEAARKMEPKTTEEAVVFQQILTKLDSFGEYRALRLQAAQEELPGPIWLALLAGAGLTVFFSYLFGCANLWAHILMTGTLATLNGVAFYVVLNLDHPFTGETSMSPAGFERALADFSPPSPPAVHMLSR